jgi:hypothetical protein
MKIAFFIRAIKKDAGPSLLQTAPAKGRSRTAPGQRPFRGAGQVAASATSRAFQPRLAVSSGSSYLTLARRSKCHAALCAAFDLLLNSPARLG